MTDGPFPREQVLADFTRAAAGIDPAVRAFVVGRVTDPAARGA